ncbi:MAG: asparagine synthase-related protein, partial [Nitrosopumilaceae archaeon]
MIYKLDKNAIRNFLTIRYNPLEEPPIRPATWKDFQPNFSDPNGYQSEKLLKNSILKLSAQKKGHFVVSLSSGIDSTLCLALLRKAYPQEKIVAICGVFEEGFDESKRAKEIATKFEADFKVVYMDSIFTRMPEIVFISKKPRWNTYQHIIAKEARKYGNILVTGDGADEIFGGYNFRYHKFLNLLRPHEIWKTIIINYLECYNRDWVPAQE